MILGSFVLMDREFEIAASSIFLWKHSDDDSSLIIQLDPKQ